MEKEPGNEQADPDDKTEQADAVHRSQLADTLFHQFLEIRHQTDGEEAEQEEQAAEHIALTAGSLGGA